MEQVHSVKPIHTPNEPQQIDNDQSTFVAFKSGGVSERYPINDSTFQQSNYQDASSITASPSPAISKNKGAFPFNFMATCNTARSPSDNVRLLTNTDNSSNVEKKEDHVVLRKPEVNKDSKRNYSQNSRTLGLNTEVTLTHPIISNSTNIPNINEDPKQISSNILPNSENTLGVTFSGVITPTIAAPVNNAGTNVNQDPNAMFNTMRARMRARIYREVHESTRVTFIFYCIMFNLYAQSFLLLKGIISYKVPFTILLLNCVAQITFIIRERNTATMTIKQKRGKYLQIVEWLIFGLFLVASLLIIEGIKIYLLPFIALGFISCILFHYYCDVYKSHFDKESLTVFKLMTWLSLMLVGCKVDALFPEWRFVFYVFIGISFLAAVSGTVIIMISIYDVITMYNDPNFRICATGQGWICLNILTTVIISLCSLGLIKLTSDNKPATLQFALIAGLIHQAVLIIYITIFKNNIKRFILIPLLFELTEKLEKAKSQRTFKTTTEAASYLIKISPTYFMEMPKKFQIKDKQQAEEWKQKIRNIKQQNRPVQAKLREKIELEKNDYIHTETNRFDKEVSKKEEFTREKSLKGKHSEMKVNGDVILNLVKSPANEHQKIFYSLDDLDIRDKNPNPLEERKTEETEKQCVVCFSEDPDAVFMGCGHGGVCYECAVEAWKKNDNCLLCREPIDRILKISIVNGVNVAKVVATTRKNPIAIDLLTP